MHSIKNNRLKAGVLFAIQRQVALVVTYKDAPSSQKQTPATSVIAKGLTAAMFHALADMIIVHAPDKSTGHRRQQIGICYNFVGHFDLSRETATIETAVTATGTKERA